VLELVLNDH